MGELQVIKFGSREAKAKYIHLLLKDIEALELMIERGMIETSPIRVGAEQEFCLIKNNFSPSHNSIDVLNEINDDHFTTEIGNFNLEINLDPVELKNDCFSQIAKNLDDHLAHAKKAAEKYDSKILLTGILPTLSLKHISIENMTERERYSVLNEAIKASRRENFGIHIKGVDELNLLHDTVMLEGCNTSFQIHLQIHPDDFVNSYNWAQAISGPILAACTNSPILFGKELWDETRIALFTQSVDTRANSFLLNEKQSRVSFGSEWSKGNAADIFKDNISRFRSLLTSNFNEDSVEQLNRGEIPKLKALCLHNGTVYRWNRACYGVGDGKPHLRIENRYIPSGPTMADEIANMMFWVGVMKGRPKDFDHVHKTMSFKEAKTNFFNAARYGMATQFHWKNEFVPSHKLILDELLPMAYRGLYSVGIEPRDAEYYLTMIENRVKSNSGSQWITKSYRNLLKTNKPFQALQILTEEMYNKQEKNYPVSTWTVLDQDTTLGVEDEKLVKHVMSTDIFSVDERDSLELVLNIMKWKNIHHMPVIDEDKKLIGLLSWIDVEKFLNDGTDLTDHVKTKMIKKVFTINQYDTLKQAKAKMDENNINSLPVVKDGVLIGIITSNDF